MCPIQLEHQPSFPQCRVPGCRESCLCSMKGVLMAVLASGFGSNILHL